MNLKHYHVILATIFSTSVLAMDLDKVGYQNPETETSLSEENEPTKPLKKRKRTVKKDEEKRPVKKLKNNASEAVKKNRNAIASERKIELAKYINSIITDKKAKTNGKKLAEMYKVSRATINTDLAYLQDTNTIPKDDSSYIARARKAKAKKEKPKKAETGKKSRNQIMIERRNDIGSYIERIIAGEEEKIGLVELATKFNISRECLHRDLGTLKETDVIPHDDSSYIAKKRTERSVEEVEEDIRDKMSKEDLLEKYCFSCDGRLFDFINSKCSLKQEEYFYLRSSFGKLGGAPGDTRDVILDFLERVMQEREDNPFESLVSLLEAFNNEELYPRPISEPTFGHHLTKLGVEHKLSPELLKFIQDSSTSNLTLTLL